ncbi:MAG: Crp/Fnr family transcriptional regulator [Muribaculaceae bacterium]|nr:Crp/Fnr family transcriptional regulator [Muribaculaceae bacterium]
MDFNTYKESSVVDFWHDLCAREGELRHYDRGDYFFREGEVARYLGFIESGTFKYITFGEDGTEHVMGLEFTGGFVTDFPFSIHGYKARTSVIAASPSDIRCVSVARIRELLAANPSLESIMADSTEAVFGMVYDRYKALYAMTPQERYNDMISRHPDLFSLFSLRDIASFLKITPTHLSRLRKNI